MWNCFCNWFVKITGAIPQYFFFRTKVYYEDKQVQSTRIQGKAILVSNHRSIWDFAVLMFVFWRRTLRCLMAEIIFEKNIFLRFFLKSLGGIKVDRNTKDLSFVAKSCRILEQGGVIEIYPESRLPRVGETCPLPFKSSAAYIALMSGAPLIPVYTNGCCFQKERTRVIIGKPIDVRELYDESRSEKENLSAITDCLRNKITELEKELEKQKNEERKTRKKDSDRVS